jgi:hypothetical protein
MKRPTVLFLALFSSLLLLAASCSDSPTDAADPVSSQTTGEVDPVGDSEFQLGTVVAGPASARVEVWASNLTVEPGGVSFDAVIVNTSRTDIAAPIHFVITDIRPDDVVVSNADFVGADGAVFDFSDDVGDDGILSAGEMSAPVTMAFAWPEPMAFAIGFRVDVGDSAADGFISGVVFDDRNLDGTYDPDNEPGIPGIVVELRPSAREILYRTRTDHRGVYIFDGLSADVYTAHAKLGNQMHPTTPNPLIVTLVELPDGTVASLEGVNFGFAVEHPPPPSARIFGPVPVGPGSPFGTELDSTFVVPDFFAAVDLFLRVVPPPLLGPFPVHIDEAAVRINDMVVWEFVCPTPDSLCAPADWLLLDPALLGRENTIHIQVLGNDQSFLMFSIEAETILPPH